jgi:MFS transporter, SP family, general alpha glucoside:H+ symporter
MAQARVAKQLTDEHATVIEIKTLDVSPSRPAKQDSFFASVRKHKWALIWCLYMLWCILANNYAKTAGQSVLGIPQFRKDFGTAYNGNYVLSATWQSAYYGAPQAA